MDIKAHCRLFGLYSARPAVALLCVLLSSPASSDDKRIPYEDNDATYSLPMYIPKVVQQKTVHFDDDDTDYLDNDAIYAAPVTTASPKPARRPAPATDNDSNYTLPGEYSPTRNRIQSPTAAVQPQYQQPVQQYQQPAYQQPVQQQPAQQQYRSNQYYYQQYNYDDQNQPPTSGPKANYPTYYQ